tara:strand:- start:2160 stop:2465 length:306 start_codon:yes stop_codon:yes gene_type:complete
MLLLQAETVQNLLSATDVTIIGVLLAVIALLVYYNIRTDKKLEERTKYIMEQDKANTTMMIELTNAVNNIGQTSEKNTVKIEGVDEKASNILVIIKERLSK